nr:hypothetical protein [Tanacetum cinerariifolium]
NLISASPTPTLRIHKDHPKSQIIGPVDTPNQTRHKSKEMEEQSFIATIYQKTDPALLQFCLFLCFLSQVEPKKYSAFLYGTIDEEVYVMQPPGFQDLTFPARVYKVEKAMYGLHQASRACFAENLKLLCTKNSRERDEVAEAAILSLTLHKTALAAESQENSAKVKEKLDEEEIEKMVEGGKDEESYASEFVDSLINDDVDDFGTKIEPESHKEYPKIVNDDDDQIEKEKNDVKIKKEKKDEEIVMEKDDDD